MLRLLRDSGERSRAAVAAATGLNKATVSSLVAELMERHLVHEVGLTPGGLGRPATLLQLDGRNIACVGLEVNVDVVEVLVTDLAGRHLFQRTRPVDVAGTTPARALRTLATLTDQALAAVEPVATTVAGITVAVPGLVDVTRNAVALAPNLGWRDVDAGPRLAAALEVRAPVSLENDANLVALAEYRAGAHAGTPNLVAITGQTGIGGGIVIEGRLVRGATGFSGEVGHLHVSDDGPRCGCGRQGCWEAHVGLKALLRAAVPDLSSDLERDATLGPDAKVRHVVARAEAGDGRALDALRVHGEWIGRGASILVNLFNPQVVVLGGFFRDVAPWILGPATETMRHLSLAPDAGGCELAVSTLGFSAASLGGAIHAAERVFDDPTTIEPPQH